MRWLWTPLTVFGLLSLSACLGIADTGLLQVYGQFCSARKPQLELLDLAEARRLRGFDFSPLERTSALQADTALYLGALFHNQSAELESISSSDSQYESFLNQTATYSSLVTTGIPTREVLLSPEAGCAYVVIAEGQNLESLHFNIDLKSEIDGKVIALTLSSFAFSSALNAMASTAYPPSLYARLIHSYFVANALGPKTRPVLCDALKRMTISHFRFQGIDLELNAQLDFSVTGNILAGIPVNDSLWTFQNSRYPLKAVRVEFHGNGAVKRICPAQTVAYRDHAANHLELFCPENLSSFDRGPQPIEFHDNGGIARARVSQPATVQTALVDLQLTPKKQRFETVDNALVTATREGLFTLITNASGAVFIQNQWLRIEDRQSVSFFDDGTPDELILVDAMTALIQNETVPITSWVDFSAPGILNSAEIVEQVCLKRRDGGRQCFAPGERLYFLNELVL